MPGVDSAPGRDRYIDEYGLGFVGKISIFASDSIDDHDRRDYEKLS